MSGESDLFTFDTPHRARRTDGTVVPVTVPAEFPPAVEADGLLFRFERHGYRVADGAPAGFYVADEGSTLWLCDGRGHVCG